MNIELLKGKVIAIDSEYVDGQGVNIPQIFIVGDNDGNMITIPWLPTGDEQTMPLLGQKALYWKQGDFDFGIIKFYGTNPNHIRKGQFGLDAGEHITQSDSGLGYTKYAKDGSVQTVSGDGASTVTANSDGVAVQAPAIVMNIFGGLSLELREDGSFHLVKTTKSGGISAEISVDAQDKVMVFSQSDIVLKGKNIVLDGNITMGPGVSDSGTALKAAPVVTAGAFGTHPVDLVTGVLFEGTPGVRALS